MTMTTRLATSFLVIALVLAGPIISTSTKAQEAPPHQIPDLSLAPTLVAQLIHEGLAFHEAGNHAEAIKRFHAAHHISPIQPATFMALANAYEGLGGHPLAIAAWNRALIGVAPDIATARKARQIAKDKHTQMKILLAATANRIADNLTYGDLGPTGLRGLLPLWVSIGHPQQGRQMVPLLPEAEQRAAALAIANAAIEAGDLSTAMSLVIPLTEGEDRSGHLGRIAAEAVLTGDFTTMNQARAEMSPGPAYQRLLAEGHYQHGGAVRHMPPLSDDAPKDAVLTFKLGQAKATGAGPDQDLLAAIAVLSDLDHRARLTLQAVEVFLKAGDKLGAIGYARAIKRGPTRYRALSLVASAQGDDSKAQTFLWTALAMEAEKLTDLKSLNKAVQQVAIDRDQATVDAAAMTASTIARHWAKMHAPR